MIYRNIVALTAVFIGSSQSFAWSIKVTQFDGSKAQTKMFKLSNEQSYEPKDLIGISCFAVVGEVTRADKKAPATRNLELECREGSQGTRFAVNLNCTAEERTTELLIKPSKFTAKSPQYSFALSCN